MEEFGFVHVATVDVNRLDEALAKLAKKKIETKVKEQPGSARPGAGSIISSRRLILVPEAELLRAREVLGIKSAKAGMGAATKAVFVLAVFLVLAVAGYLVYRFIL
jgi:hypothetical protein